MSSSAGDKSVTCRVIRNYGRHLVGATIEVPEREYFRLREPIVDDEGEVTGHMFPVLISPADEEAERKRLEVLAAQAAMQKKVEDEERATALGWAEYERRSLDALRADYVARQRRVREDLAGAEERLAAGAVTPGLQPLG